MNEILKFLKSYGVLFVFIIITAIGIKVLFLDSNNYELSHLYVALDTASSVALALLAFYAYWEYARNKRDTQKFLDQLKQVTKNKNKEAFLGIQFGGSNANASLEMRQFAEEKGISKTLILIKKFGDEKNKVSKSDMKRLERYLKEEVIPMFSGADRIHLVVSGVGIAYYICGDVFSNWKPIIVYHRNKEGKYEIWTTDNKHREKIESTMKDVL